MLLQEVFVCFETSAHLNNFFAELHTFVAKHCFQLLAYANRLDLDCFQSIKNYLSFLRWQHKVFDCLVEASDTGNVVGFQINPFLN